MTASLDQEIRNVVARIEMDEKEGGASADDVARLSEMMDRWTRNAQFWPFRTSRGRGDEVCFLLKGAA